MKKFFYLLILCIFFTQNNVSASTTTYPRTRENLGVDSWVELDEETIQNILNTPKVNEDEKIYDFANILSSVEETMLYDKINQTIESTGLDIIILTIEKNNKKTPGEYADDFYNFNNFGKNKTDDGILFLIDMDNRVSWFSTTGKGILYFDDYRIDKMDEDASYYLLESKYYDASSSFIDNVLKYFNEGIPKGNEGYELDVNGNLVKRKEINWAISLIVPLIISTVTISIMISKHKMIKRAIYANNYLNRNNIVLFPPIDTFLTTHTTMIRINRDSNRRSSGSSGRSSTHRSSGGRFNGGGGGRRF